MTNLRDIREALAAKIADGIHRAVNVNPYEVDNWPCVSVADAAEYITLTRTMSVSSFPMTAAFEVRIIWSAADPVSAQIAIDDLQWSGSSEVSSIRDALLAGGATLDLGTAENTVQVGNPTGKERDEATDTWRASVPVTVHVIRA